MSLRLHTCPPGREAVLVDELERVFPASRHRMRSAGWVESHLDPGDERRSGVSVAFAAQCLPAPVPLAAASISLWTGVATTLLIEQLHHHDGPWRLHVFCVDHPGAPVTAVRCRLIETSIHKALKERLRRLARTRVIDPATPWQPGEVLVQIGLETASKGWLSLADPEARMRLERCLSRFPGGVLEVPEDERAPSKAFRKLVEVELRLGRRIEAGERCVDLGGSPGGWSYIALERGASVTAVDRSPLRDDLMSHPRLTFVQGDAFRFEPDSPVDWLLCDVIAFPARTLELLDRWLERGLCRFFCVTVKFRGAEEYAELERFKGMLRRREVDFTLRQLTSNRNEVTAWGEARER